MSISMTIEDFRKRYGNKVRIRTPQDRRAHGLGRKAAQRCRCKQNHNHQSRLESGHCDVLYALKRNGKILEIQTQKKLELRVNGVLVCNHYPDQIVTWADGRKEIIESKGFREKQWKLKKALTEICYPGLKYVVWELPGGMRKWSNLSKK